MDLNEKISTTFKLGDAIWLQDLSIYVFPIQSVYYNIKSFAPRLQEIRDHFNREVFIHSWYRPKSYSKIIGSKDSTGGHLLGLAADIEIDGICCEEAELELEKYLEEFNINLKMNSKDSLHIDILPRPKRYF